MMLSEQLLPLYNKLAQIQTKLPNITKDSEANAGKFSWSYVSLPVVLEYLMPLFQENSLYFNTRVEEGATLVVTITDLTTGAFVTSTMELSEEHEKFQEIGKQITYYTRYLLLSMLGIVATEDDDGTSSKHASAKGVTRKKTATGKRRSSFGSNRRKERKTYKDEFQKESSTEDDYDDIPFDQGEEDDDEEELPIPQKRRPGRLPSRTNYEDR